MTDRSAMKSVMPSTLVAATETLPSSGLGNNCDNNGFSVRVPAITPSQSALGQGLAHRLVKCPIAYPLAH